MLVTATKRGYFNRLREPGDQFEYPLKKGDKMPSWMIATNKAKSAKATEAAEAAELAAEEASKAETAAAMLADKKAEEAEKAARIAAEEEAKLELDAGDNPLDIDDAGEGTDEGTGDDPLS